MFEKVLTGFPGFPSTPRAPGGPGDPCKLPQSALYNLEILQKKLDLTCSPLAPRSPEGPGVPSSP